MTPKEIGRLAGRIFTGCTPPQIVLRPQEDQEDYGIDCEAELQAEGDRATGFIFKIQIKGQEAATRIDGGSTISYRELPTQKLRYYLDQIPVPVVLALVETSTRSVHWLVLDGNQEVIDALHRATQANRKTVTLHIPVANTYPDRIPEMITETRKAFDWITVNRASSMDAARLAAVAERGKLHQAPESSLVVTFATSVLTVKQSPAPGHAQGPWQEKNRQIKSLLDRGAIETAHALAELALQDEDVENAPKEQVAKIENNLASCLVRMGQQERALEHLERACNLDPASTVFLDNLLAIRSNVDPRAAGLLDEIENALTNRQTGQLQAAKAQVLAATGDADAASEWITQCYDAGEHSPEFLRAAAVSAMSRQDYSLAMTFVEDAVGRQPQDADILRLKGDLLLIKNMHEVRGVMVPPIIPTPEQRRDLRESADMLTAALSILTGTGQQRTHEVADTRTQRAVVSMAMGEVEQAHTDFSQSIQDNPGDCVARFNRAVLEMRLGRNEHIDEDCQYLIENSSDRGNALRLYISHLSSQGKAREIRNLAERFSSDIATDIEVSFMSALAGDDDSRPYRCARQFLRTWKAAKGISPRLLRCYSYVLDNMGHTSWAVRALDRAKQEANSEIERCNAAQALAAIYARQKRWDDACANYALYVPLNSYSPDLTAYLFALFSSRGAPHVIEKIARDLSPSARQNPNVRFLLAQLQEAAGALPSAGLLFWRLWRELDSPECAFRCAYCFFRRPQTRRRAQTILLNLASLDKLPPQLATTAASMLADIGHYEEAVHLSYSLVTSHPGDRFLEERYAGLVFIQCHDKLSLQVESVEPGVVVDVDVEGESRCWMLSPIRDEDRHLPNCEALTDDSIKEAIHGKHVGDSFDIPGRSGEQGLKATIKQIRTKELKLLHEILEAVRLRPRQDGAIWSMPARIESMMVELQKHAASVDEAIATYRDNPFPVSWFARMIGRSLPEVYWSLSHDPDIPIHAFPSDHRMIPYQASLARGDRPVVLDLQALQLADRFGLLGLMEHSAARFRVTQSAIDTFTNEAQSARLALSSTSTIAATKDGRISFTEVSEEERQRYYSHIQRCEQFIAGLSSSQVLPPPAEGNLPDGADDVLSLQTLDAIELANSEKLPALLGDWRLSGLLDQGQALSLRALIDRAIESGGLPVEEAADKLGSMRASGIQYISVNAGLILAARDRLLSGAAPRPFLALMAQLSPSSSDWSTACPILADCLAEFAVSRLMTPPARQQLIAHVLNAVFPNGATRRYIRPLRNELAGRLMLAPIHLQETLNTMDTWARFNPPRST